MVRLAPIALAALLAAPAAAQEAEGPSLFERGAEGLLRGLVDEVAPQVEELTGIGADLLPTFRLLAQEMGPAFVDVFGRIDSINNYEPPAILPNGDIVIRRRPDAPNWVPEGDGPEVQL